MHAYSSGASRVGVYGLLAVFAVVLSWLLVLATDPLNIPAWLIGAPSMGGTFALLYRWVDQRLWKQDLLRKLGLIDVLDISGSYEGQLISTFKDEEGRPVVRNLTITIQQTWTELSMTMKVEGGGSTSTSDSATASIAQAGPGTRVTYVYQNRVNPAVADDDMADHVGAAEVTILGADLEGRYFNARPRAGTIKARRI